MSHETPVSPATPKIRLKPRLHVEPPPPATGAAGTPAPEPAAAPPPAWKLAAPPPRPEPTKSEAPSIFPSLRPPAPVFPSEEEMAEANRKLKRAALGIGFLGVIVFAGVGALAYPRLLAQTRVYAEAEERYQRAQAEATSDDEARPAERPVAAPVPPPATPASSPRASTSGTPAAPASAAAAAATSPAAAAPTPSPAAPGTAAAPAPVEADPFKAWVSQLKINGVRMGNVPKVLIGGKPFSPGDVVNSELGIVFDSFDPQTRMLRFRDRSGAVLERKER